MKRKSSFQDTSRSRVTEQMAWAHLVLASMVLLAMALTCVVVAQGQNATADVLGTVTDQSGAVLPGATITITNLGTGISQTTTTNGTGDYVFNLLQVGTYSLEVEIKGFKAFVVPNIPLSAGDRAREDAKMNVGDVAQRVEVSGSVAPALQTDSQTVGSLVTSQAVQDVPLNGRNVTQLVQLSPGVSVGAQNDLPTGNRPDDRRQTSEYTVNGNGTTLNNNLIDGMDNNERFIGTLGVRPSVDAIQEIVVQTNAYDASVGRTGGGVVNVITKSGTNDFHGSAYEFFRNAVLNTNPNYQFPAGYASSGTELLSALLPKPAFRQNQYGASLGGPIKKNKTFFFGDFEQFRQAYGLPLIGTVPTLCQRGSKMAAAQGYKGSAITCPDGATPANPGDFSELNNISAYGGSSAPGPANSGPVIPMSAMNPVGLALFSSYPLPNNSALTNNYSFAPMRTQQSTTFDGRIDHHFSDSNTFFSRYSFNDVTTLTPTNFPVVTINSTVDPLWTGSPLTFNPGGQSASFPGTAKQRQQQLTISFVHVYSSNLLLNLKAGYLRSITRSLPPDQLTNVSNALGMTCNPTNCVNFGSSGSSGLALFTDGYTQLGDEGFIPLENEDNTFQYAADLTWNKNSHSVKFGLTLIRRQVGEYQSSNPNGTFTFSGNYTGVAPADFLEGLASSVSRSYYITSPLYLTWEPGAYVQDNWRAKRWLTLNLGMRYDIFTPYTERRGRISNFNPVTGLIDGPTIPGAQQTGNTALAPTPYRDISPRFGFEASLRHNFVVRGGFALTFYPAGPAIGTLRNAPFNFSFSCSVQNTGQSAVVCPSSIASSAVAEYGPTVTSPSSPVGQAGGSVVSSALPAPYLNINTAFAPSAAQCTFTTLAAYSPTPTTGTCPSATNPYSGSSASAMWVNATAGYLEGFNLQVQKELGANVVTLGYVGQLGRHAFLGYSPNHISNINQNSVPPLAAQFPWLAKYSISETNVPWGTSSYNSMQATFVRRFSRGLTVNANYTWSHSLLNSLAVCTPTVSFSELGLGNGPRYVNPCFFDNVANPANPIQESAMESGLYGVGNSSLDVPNRISGTANYVLPLAKNANRFEGFFINGWTVNGAVTWQTGYPYTVGTGISLPGVGGGRPDQICSGMGGSKTLASWGINPSCFRIATQNTYGNELSNQFFGPSNKYANFSIFKEFALTERFHLQFRTEIFNLFNTPNFSAPSSTNVPYYNGSGCANGPGTCGVGLLQNPNVPTSLKLGAITSLNNNYNSRQIQFAMKVLF